MSENKAVLIINLIAHNFGLWVNTLRIIP